MTENGTPKPASRILTLDSARQAKTDDHGRKLSHNVTVQEAHEIAIEEQSKVMEHYLNQVPPHVARMIQDALLHYGLIKPIEPVDIAPTPPTASESQDSAGEATHGPAGVDSVGGVPAEPAS